MRCHIFQTANLGLKSSRQAACFEDRQVQNHGRPILGYGLDLESAEAVVIINLDRLTCPFASYAPSPGFLYDDLGHLEHQ